jgi:protein TonB
MENSFKAALLISAAIHASIFLAVVVISRRSNYIVLPVELFFYSPPSVEPSPQAPVAPPREILQKQKEKEEVALPAKTKAPPSSPPKTEARPQPETRSVPANDQPSRTAPSGNQISLDTAQFPYTYYTNIIVKKIGRNWQWGSGFGQMKTVLYFKIRRSGDITEVNVKKSSGDRLFDDQAVRSIKLSSPFPPLPDGYAGDDLGVFFEFGFKE